MEKSIAAILDEIWPNRPPFINRVEVMYPEIAKYAEMSINSKITKKYL